MTNFKGAAKSLDDVDIPRIGAKIGVGEDEIHAVLDVEAGGKSFDSQGRPKMLFEPHIFYRQLQGAQRAKAVKAGLAYPKWRRNYPKDSYPRLVRAMAINSEAALKSASWGGPQIMGYHHGLLGYPTAAAMVQAFAADAENHLDGMVAFIKGNNLDDELRDHNWSAFARGYNGSGYKKNRYDTKLAAAFAKWQKIRDTPIDQPTPERPPVTPPVAPRVSQKKTNWFVAILESIMNWRSK